MSSMFYDVKFFNQEISNWDVSNVTDISNMFWGASSFNQDLSKWNTKNVINFASFTDDDNKNFILPKVNILKNNKLQAIIKTFPQLLDAINNKNDQINYLGMSNFKINSPLALKAENTDLIKELNFSTLIFNDLYKGFIENKSNTSLEQMKKGYTIKLSNKPKLYTLLFKNSNNKDHEHILLFTNVMKPIVLKNHINVVNKENIIEELKNTDSSFKNVDLELKNNIINNQAVIKLKSDHNLYDDEIKVIFNTKSKFFNDNRYIILLSILGIGFLIASLGWLTYALIKRNNNK